jgi:hypothetical protein
MNNKFLTKEQLITYSNYLRNEINNMKTDIKKRNRKDKFKELFKNE